MNEITAVIVLVIAAIALGVLIWKDEDVRDIMIIFVGLSVGVVMTLTVFWALFTLFVR